MEVMFQIGKVINAASSMIAVIVLFWSFFSSNTNRVWRRLASDCGFATFFVVIAMFFSSIVFLTTVLYAGLEKTINAYSQIGYILKRG